MANLNISLPDPMKEFVDRKIGSGRFKDASDYVQLLIAEDMESTHIDFSPEEKERIDQMLLEAVDQIDRGEYAPWRKGEGRKILDEVIRRHQKNREK